MAAAAGTAAVPSAAALEATGRRARDPRVRAGGSRVRTVHRPTWPGLGVHPSRTRPTARVCTEGRFDLARAHAAHGGLQGRLSCSRGGCLAHAPCGGARTTRVGAHRAQPDIATATRSRAAPRSRVLTRTLAHSCGAGCALVWAMRWGDARVVDASGLRSGAMHGPRARTATVAEPSSTLVGPQQRARAHHEEQPGDAASFGEGGSLIRQHPSELFTRRRTL